jgi:hypothetical protein
MPTHAKYYLTETRGGKTRRYVSGWANDRSSDGA